MKFKIIGWNINQRSGMGEIIPQFVIDEIVEQKADIIVLSELYKGRNIRYFWNEMERAGFSSAITKNDGTNEVGILWKSSLFTLLEVDASVVSGKENNNPNFLMVDLLDENKEVLTVIGYRIRMVNYEERAEELGIVVNIADGKENPVVMVTDSNNLRRGTVELQWNLELIDQILLKNGLKRYTPKGQSIFTENSNKGENYEFAEDHIIGRGLKIELGEYDRDFVYRAPLVYQSGKDFQTYNSKGECLSIKPGYPDHAIVKGYIATVK